MFTAWMECTKTLLRNYKNVSIISCRLFKLFYMIMVLCKHSRNTFDYVLLTGSRSFIYDPTNQYQKKIFKGSQKKQQRLLLYIIYLTLRKEKLRIIKFGVDNSQWYIHINLQKNHEVCYIS